MLWTRQVIISRISSVKLYRTPSSTPPSVADATHRFPPVAILTSLTSSLCLAALLGLGIYVNANKFIVGTKSTPGYQVVDLETGSWKVMYTFITTTIGILAVVAFSNQDDIFTRRVLAYDQDVLAIFLRPLTIKRGLKQNTLLAASGPANHPHHL
ncbi:MAG: hypothetical protein Q9221_008667 [Calogaya cf. arnoldii]